MVYESDFYTTRRPYSRPLVSTYTVTVSIQTLNDFCVYEERKRERECERMRKNVREIAREKEREYERMREKGRERTDWKYALITFLLYVILTLIENKHER